jgi:hypothetical protein
MKGEIQPEPRHFTAGEWINKKEISLSPDDARAPLLTAQSG